MLEKTRIIHQIPGERNYHIFYHLLNGAGPETLGSLRLDKPMSYFNYLINTELDAQDIKPQNEEKKDFDEVISCLSSVGIGKDFQSQIFQLISGILYLGNIDFCCDSNDEVVSDVKSDTKDHLAIAAQMLGFEPEQLILSMTSQNMYVNGATIVKSQTLSQVDIYPLRHYFPRFLTRNQQIYIYIFIPLRITSIFTLIFFNFFSY